MPSKPILNKTNVKQKFISFVKSFTASELAYTNEIASRANYQVSVFPSQDTLAKKTGYSVRTIGRAAKKLDESGCVMKKTRFWVSSVYYLNAIFNDPELRWELRDLIPAFKIRPLIPLLIIPLVNADIENNKISFSTKMSDYRSPSYSYSSPNNYLFINNANDSYKKEEKNKKEGQGREREACARGKSGTFTPRKPMDFQELLDAMTLSTPDKQIMTIFTLHTLQVMALKQKDYRDFKEFFEATIAYSKAVHQHVDYQKLGRIREEQNKKRFQRKQTSKPKETIQVVPARQPAAYKYAERVLETATQTLDALNKMAAMPVNPMLGEEFKRKSMRAIAAQDFSYTDADEGTIKQINEFRRMLDVKEFLFKRTETIMIEPIVDEYKKNAITVEIDQIPTYWIECDNEEVLD